MAARRGCTVIPTFKLANEALNGHVNTVAFIVSKALFLLLVPQLGIMRHCKGSLAMAVAKHLLMFKEYGQLKTISCYSSHGFPGVLVVA